MVYQGADEYHITYTGVPPEKQKIALHAYQPSGFKVRMYYAAGDTVYSVFMDDNLKAPVSPTEFDDSIQGYPPLKPQCGENVYMSLENYLEFYLTPGCVLQIHPRKSISLGVRLEFSLEEFFSSGGVTSFVDNMAASLGIHAADIKVVSVYEGSTIVDFEILEAVSAVADAVAPSINLEAVA